MNLLDATVLSIRGTVRAEAPGLRADLWAGTTEDLDVVLGIQAGTPPHGNRRGGRLTHRHSRFRREPRQRGEIAYCTVGDATVCVRSPRPIAMRAGHSLTLTTDPEHVHLFDRSSGRRLEWNRHLAALRLPRLFR